MVCRLRQNSLISRKVLAIALDGKSQSGLQVRQVCAIQFGEYELDERGLSHPLTHPEALLRCFEAVTAYFNTCSGDSPARQAFNHGLC